MFVTSKAFTAAQFNSEMRATQMVDWLTACGVPATRDSLDGSNGNGPLRVRTSVGDQVVPFLHWVIPVGHVGVIVPPGAFAELFADAAAAEARVGVLEQRIEAVRALLREVADMWTGRDAFMPVATIQRARELLAVEETAAVSGAGQEDDDE